MPRGDKRHYTAKQKRQAQHIEKGMEKRGMPKKQAAARAWRVVNAEHGGGELKGGSGYGKPENHEPSKRGGKKSMAKRTKASRSAAAKKAAATRKRNAALADAHRSAAAKKAWSSGHHARH